MAPIGPKSVAQERVERKKALRHVRTFARQLDVKVHQLERRIDVSLDNKLMLDVSTAVAIADRYADVVKAGREFEASFQNLVNAFQS